MAIARRSAVNRIPFEIWLQIKELIASDDSESLYSINRAWFEIVMNSRYEVLDITKLNDRTVSRLPLLRDSGIARRVRHLSISGMALQVSLLKSIMGESWTEFPMQRKTLSILNRKIRTLSATNVLNDQIRLVSEIISRLTVTEYTVKWDHVEGIQSGEIIHSSLQAAILDLTWLAFGSTLRKLHVSAVPGRFHAVVSSDVQLVCLEELHLHLLQKSSDFQFAGIQDVFPESASSFLSRVNPGLNTLSVQCSSNLDLSSIFHQLPGFKSIRRLDLKVLVDHSVLADPCGLESFFAGSSLKLRHLAMALCHRAVVFADRVISSLAMSRAVIPSLENLEIDFGMPHPELANTLLTELHSLFRGTRTTLHTIILEGIPLSLVDLKTLTSVFADGAAGDALQNLIISIQTLTVEHVAVLARNVPHIRILGIVFMRHSFVPDGPVAAASEYRTHLKAQLEQENIQWTLHDISIWYLCRTVDTSRWDLVSLFPACFPTVKGFFGQARTEPEHPRSALAVATMFNTSV
ncbi:heat shock protein 12A [Favolaschia claudopus]|uniref:Heat shock protein 12A n=1 Tax=Favolaschia claudopus TaxID=2862362 RepID=A0AAW0CK11_9AGAR